MRLAGLVLIGLLWVGYAEAATINAASCSRANVQTAINTAVNGDTVQIPAGSCTWTSQVNIPNTKGIILKGAGIDVTTIIDGVTGGVEVGGTLVVQTAVGNAVSEVTAMTFDANNDSENAPQVFLWGAGLNAWRVHHIKVKNISEEGVQSAADETGSVEFSGLIDHNIFECPFNSSCKATDIMGGWDPLGEDSFGRPLALGTNQMTYIEDNTYDYDFSNDDVGESISGARWVYRYNTFINVSAGWHGADSGYIRGIHSFEMYRNTFASSVSERYALNARSGTGVIFDNAWSGNYTDANFQIYRVEAAQVVGTRNLACAGSETWDGNLGSGSSAGWPCLDQTGWIFGVGAGHSDNPTFTSVPLYWWGNTLDAARLDPVPGVPEIGPYFVADRDYYRQGTSFNGTSGTGVGTLASRPATCTGPNTTSWPGNSVGGVGYWATDQGTWNQAAGTPGGQGVLYKCTATNTWTLYYTPYTYPHPLQGGTDTTAPAAPTGVTVS